MVRHNRYPFAFACLIALGAVFSGQLLAAGEDVLGRPSSFELRAEAVSVMPLQNYGFEKAQHPSVTGHPLLTGETMIAALEQDQPGTFLYAGPSTVHTPVVALAASTARHAKQPKDAGGDSTPKR